MTKKLGRFAKEIKLNPDWMAGKIDSEGFEYFFTNYASVEDFEGMPELQEYIQKYIHARDGIKEILEEHHVEVE